MLLAVPAFMLGGVTWDELFDFEGVNGAFWHGINTIKGLNPDISTITFDLEYFGNATRWPTYFFWRLLSTTPWESFSGLSRTATILSGSYVGLNHLNAVTFGLLGIGFVSLIGWQLGGRHLALWSGVFLALLPTWLGHSWMNSKDIPFATSYLVYTYGSVLLLARHSRNSSNPFFGSSTVFRVIGVALLLGSRIGSLPFVVIAELVYIVILRRHYLGAGLSVIFGILLGYVLTPQAWSAPIGYPIAALNFIGDRQGAISPAHTFSYIAHHLYESLPLLIVIGLLILLVYCLTLPGLSRRIVVWAPLLLQLFTAPVLLVVGSKSIYNELRHILFIFPPICVLSAYGWLRYLGGYSPRGFPRRLAALSLLFLVLALMFEDVSLAPYQYIYRSDLARLLSPGQNLHRDYWGYSARETIQRCLRTPSCSGFVSSSSFRLREGDWNPVLFDGYRELLQPDDFSQPPHEGHPALELQVSNSRDQCKSVVETSRRLFFPVRSVSLISRIADCS